MKVKTEMKIPGYDFNLKGTSSNSWMASKSFKKPTSALRILQIDVLFAVIFALNLTFLIHLAAYPELIEIP